MIWSRPKRDIMDYLISKMPECIVSTPKQIGEACGKLPHLAASWATNHLQVLWAQGYVKPVLRGCYRATLEGKRDRDQAPQLREERRGGSS